MAVNLDKDSDGSFGMLPLKKIYRSQCSLFCNTTSKVDSFIKFHAGGNLGEQDISTYRSTVTAVIGMCKDFEFELGQFIKKWSSGKEDGEPSNQHGAARSEKRKREGLSDRTDVHVEPKEFKEITQQQKNPHDADSSDFEEGKLQRRCRKRRIVVPDVADCGSFYQAISGMYDKQEGKSCQIRKQKTGGGN
ncbi:uncharacterized protein LOC100845751 [Brachypodium distachyon]|uniref:uncharacterized protein LOC100845751 n=1 Tax=Brachypodium distachyon TaxID=15368 RepID=UPI000234F590|nr:uncharacterized protein LOC100845751 [Brachypodium distachyon]XP_014751431.1 uncharacterized protein LOC100845751 [Brachypodium distachyon]XP_024311456.1 uncharacterized protein LOC100845751 [Brachypodium distachyon]XP_024311457.1 uncharacterized protein LOC100845751 [Brachypodium distachyon]|eukprot:XP_003579897.1 uncharacterized protein LOC100845751 [Brachypodium distachyon]